MRKAPHHRLGRASALGACSALVFACSSAGYDTPSGAAPSSSLAPSAAGGGSPSTPDGNPISAPPSGTADPQPETTTPPGGDPSCQNAGPGLAPARLLSASQYNNTVLELFRVDGDPGTDLGNGVFDSLDDVRVEQRADVAASVAQQAAANLDQWAPCVPPATGDVSVCAAQLIDQVGRRAFRRPLTDGERAEMTTLFDAGFQDGGFSAGVEWLLTGILQAPDFMYQIALPQPGETPGEPRQLGPYEYASRLAYFVWDSPPDDALLDAAAAGALSDPAKQQAQLDRMLEDERAQRGVVGFHSRWLNTVGFREIARDVPEFDGAVASSLMTSLLMSVTELYEAGGAPKLSDLLSGETYYMNDVLRRFYGLPAGDEGFTPVTLSGEGRHGIVTHPALMALLARPAESFPIARGLFVTRSLFCRDIPLPMGLEIPELPPIQEGLSTRARLEQHTTNPACSGCHALFDPAGFALENFDEVGRFRTMDHGAPVDTASKMTIGSDADGPFANGEELLTRVAGSHDVAACFARRYLEFALSRQQLTPEESCALKTVASEFTSSGDLKQLVGSIATNDAFRLRLAEGVAQ